MAPFSELVRDFERIRDYMRDFYIYGFKARGEFTRKSARTYDNEKRRIESWLAPYMDWSYGRDGKRTFVSVDSARITQNPLYAAWRSKSFTSKDIQLHFYILDILRDGEALGADELCDRVCLLSGRTFDVQTVRLKCVEYAREGVLLVEKQGRALRYSLCPDTLETLLENPAPLLDALQFLQEAAPFGEVGSFLLSEADPPESPFRFKHHFVVHTLEDGALLKLLQAMRQGCSVQFHNQSDRLGNTSVLRGVPLRIFSSAWTGRRYLCLYNPVRRRFMNHRLDYIRGVELQDPYPEMEELQQTLNRSLPLVWGVSFGGRGRRELLCMKLRIDEARESFVLDRLHREGRGGEVLHIAPNTFLYTRELYDTNEIAPWIKSFTGRILALEGTNRMVVDKFYRDMERMQHLYLEQEAMV